MTDYALDTIGNVTTEKRNGQVARTFEYQVDRLQVEKNALGEVEKRYFYDPYGNLDCVTDENGSPEDCPSSTQGPASPNLIEDYSHDELNRLILFREFANGTETDKATYDYDPLDRVVQEIESHPGIANRTTNFSYLGLTSLVTVEDRLDPSQPDKAYGYDAYGTRITMTNTTQSETREFIYAYDTHGSVSALVKQAGGSVEATYGYTPYGSPEPGLTQGDPEDDDPLNPHRYSAKRLDPGSDSYDMGARQYAADTGRFIEQDFFLGSLDDLGLTVDPLTQNRYSLAGGNPISFIEWDGHMPAADGRGNGSKGPNPFRTGFGRSSGQGLDAISAGVRPEAAPLSLTVEQFENMSIAQRLDWLRWLSEEYASKYNAGRWFNAIRGILQAAEADETVRTSEFFLTADAVILHAIQQGMALQEGIIDSAGVAANRWRLFFQARAEPASFEESASLWAAAEEAATERAERRTDALGYPSSLALRKLIEIGTAWRGELQSPRFGEWVTASWIEPAFFDPRRSRPVREGAEWIFGYNAYCAYTGYLGC